MLLMLLHFAQAAIAQLGERQTEDLKVPGLIPGLGIPGSPWGTREPGFHATHEHHECLPCHASAFQAARASLHAA